MPAMPEATRTRSRWFSYSLRSLLAFITLTSVGMGLVAYERRQSQRELKLAEQVAASDVTVVSAGLLDVVDPFDPLDESQPQSWWRTAFKSLCGQRIRGVAIAEGNQSFDFSPLSGLRRVEWIYSYGTGIRDLSPLSTLTRLQNLMVNEASVSDLSPLAELRNLQSLWLEGTPVSDLSPLARLRKLETLDVNRSRVKSLAPLAGLESLAVLAIEDTPINDLSPLADLKNLEGIFLSRTAVADLAPLAGLKELVCLHLDGTRVSDLSVVFGFKQLQELTLGDGQFAEEQITSLKQALPGCRVTIVPAARTASAIEPEPD
jgi:Leucine-rich repeat (LRR) protein